MKININGSDDPSYRYQMSSVIIKIEGRGNGIKTILINIQDICKSLDRPLSHIIKYIGCELNTNSYYDKDIDKVILKGSFSRDIIQDIIYKYIYNFILCNKCNNPETVYKIRKKNKLYTIKLKCKACGESTKIDNDHNICKLIIKEYIT